MASLFKATPENPYHLSVGAVLVDDAGLVCCHYFKEFWTATFRTTFQDFYLLMRETPEAGETAEETLARGLKEEFGATGKIDRYLGSLKTRFPRGEVLVEKTTLYFLVRLESIDPSARSDDDEERASEVRWETPEFLLERMRGQEVRYPEAGLDESEILARLLAPSLNA